MLPYLGQRQRLNVGSWLPEVAAFDLDHGRARIEQVCQYAPLRRCPVDAMAALERNGGVGYFPSAGGGGIVGVGPPPSGPPGTGG